MNAQIDRLWPDPQTELSDEQLLANYSFPEERPWIRVNFISSVDGAATRAGKSGGLGDAADFRVFNLLRRPADAVLVAAGTVRTEGYGAMCLDDESVKWRESQGKSAHPVFVLVSRSLDLDPESSVFTGAPIRPIIYTTESASQERRAALAEVAELVSAGAHSVDMNQMKRDLQDRGLSHIHSEGGPHFFGALISAGAIDEVCLTVASSVEGGNAARIAVGEEASPSKMRLASVLQARDELFLRYLRA